MKRFHIITIFPEIFDSYLGESLFKRAREKKLIAVQAYDLRDFSLDRHQKVDDRPFGGGPGMVFKVEPIYRAIAAILKKIVKPAATAVASATTPAAGNITTGKKAGRASRKVRTILFSTRGKKLDASVAQRLAKYDDLILICGRYEGVDERVAEHIADEEISIGDFVLSGGELPALVLVEAVSRFVPGFLGKEESLEEINGSFPTYTRPEIFVAALLREAGSLMKKNKSTKNKKWSVPKVLLSGDHKKIEEWRKGK